MIEPFPPLLTLHAEAIGAIAPAAADPVAAGGLMLVGGTIVLVTAIWAIGGMVAAVWTGLDSWMDRRRQASRRRPAKPMRS